jgi:hypothetical protein
MAKGYFLTEADRKALAELVLSQRGRVRSTTGRPNVPEEESFAPETYIAKTPPEGIPAATEPVGTGSGELLPGSAACNIYKVVYDEGTPTLQSIGIERTVLNLSVTSVETGTGEETGDIAGDIWIPVARDKFGDWLALGVGGGGAGGTSEVSPVIVTSLTPNASGYYPGLLSTYLTESNAWSDATEIWIIDGNP